MSTSTATRRPCATKECFATFAAAPGGADEIRHCNRSGPDGGHAHRWDGDAWQVVTGSMEHDRR